MSISMERKAVYEKLCFLMGEDAEEALQILNEQGVSAAIAFLRDYWVDEPEIRTEKPWGESDRTAYVNGLILSWNLGLQYIGLCRPIFRF